jgi:hypothetical protein
MPAITFQQSLAFTKGILYKNVGGTATQVFSGIAPETLFTPGTDTAYTATLASTNTGLVTITNAGVTNAGILPGMQVFQTAGAGAFAAGDNFVHSLNSTTGFNIGSDRQFVVRGLSAVLTAGTNVVTITNGTTSGIKVGHLVTEVGTGAGAFGNSGVVYVSAITGPTTFTVSSDTAGTTPSNHGTPGAVTFDIGGYIKFHTVANAITFRVGGVDFTNERIPGLGDLARSAFTLTNTSNLVSLNAVNVLAYLNGGDVNISGTLQETERDYHTTGLRIQKKIK